MIRNSNSGNKGNTIN